MNSRQLALHQAKLAHAVNLLEQITTALNGLDQMNHLLECQPYNIAAIHLEQARQKIEKSIPEKRSEIKRELEKLR